MAGPMLLHPGLQRPLRIVADENIPFAREAFRGFGVVRPLPADQITPATVRNCDVLLVRSVTRVDAALLEGSRVQFVGSATSGIDHVDLAYLQKRGIAFAHAPGANADAVVEYVLAALLELAVRRNVPLRGRVAGIVGCGHIGGRLARRLPALGLEVLCCDPPLAEQTGRSDFVSLETILAEADIVTLHVPLTRTGPHATYHLIDAAALARLRPSAWLLNTSRGAVVDGRSLLEARRQGRPEAVVLDVWEGEPAPDPELVAHVDLATPHIAGHSYDGKVRATLMLAEALARHLNLPLRADDSELLQPQPGDRLDLIPPDYRLPEAQWLAELVRQMYDIAADDARFRIVMQNGTPERRAERFLELRRTYPRRRSFSVHRIDRAFVPEPLQEAVAVGLGVQLVAAETMAQ
ncbi:D-isomer specific 2-hydroxyacid dehydrogenase NAD-binding protein [Rhodothermus marinus DSM 4252]|uniref:D-isomer specific 2-hydroxyacid dehydrogenase NAD-binding protein n=2 Tax=Rhodothermus marinus TaxID=29549 RepID=D0MDG3_RHOM4|nr:D-isomer specific 2-hydroxyacid dehydrogenase NAD-binding protein [Rhodothermus marinus DSM 4252]